MILKYDKKIERGVVLLELETDKFTSKENALLDKYGEPRVIINKKYLNKFPVSIDRTIKTGFKVRLRFGEKDGDETIEAAEAASILYEDIKEQMSELMLDLVEKDFDVNFENKRGADKIEY